MRVLFYPSHKIKDTRIGVALEHIKEVRVIKNDNFDVCFHWDYQDILKSDAKLRQWVGERRMVYNWALRNVTKKAVDEYQTMAFGYSSLVPGDYDRPCLSKCNKQSRPQPTIVPYPGEDVNFGKDKYDLDYRIFQKIIDTYDGKKWYVDHRVFIFMDRAFVVEKRKGEGRRFKSNSQLYRLVNMEDVFNEEEVNGIFRFCYVSGLDFGEIDVLRDRNGRVYIIDLNNLAGGGGRMFTVDKGAILKVYVEHLKEMIWEGSQSPRMSM